MTEPSDVLHCDILPRINSWASVEPSTGGYGGFERLNRVHLAPACLADSSRLCHASPYPTDQPLGSLASAETKPRLGVDPEANPSAQGELGNGEFKVYAIHPMSKERGFLANFL